MAAGKSQKNEPHESAEKPEPGDALPGQDVFDVRKVRRLVELMQQYDLSQMDLRQGTQRIQLRRGTQPHDLRAERDEPVVFVVRLVVERDVDGHRIKG